MNAIIISISVVALATLLFAGNASHSSRSSHSSSDVSAAAQVFKNLN